VRCLKDHASRFADRPFFAYIAFTSPHFPLHALQDDIARYRERYREGWDAVREQRHRRMRGMTLVDCALSERDPAAAPSWNAPEDALRKLLGSGEVGRAIGWDALSPQQKEFQAAKMAIHAAMVDRMDRQIGRVLGQLSAMNALENTVILFVSDNGASAELMVRGDGHDPSAAPGSAATFLCLGPGWSTAANTPFRLHKSWVHEGGVSSPLIVHWPAGIRDRGKLRHTPAHFIDVVPTLLELAGVDGKSLGANKGESPPPLPGRSLVDALARDIVVPRDYLYFHHIDHRALRVGDWKLVSAGGTKGEGPWELYDLKTDRCEMTDLATRHPERVQQMARQWRACEDAFRRQAGPAK
jgi:arylsulfatase A-like enzyme